MTEVDSVWTRCVGQEGTPAKDSLVWSPLCASIVSRWPSRHLFTKINYFHIANDLTLIDAKPTSSSVWMRYTRHLALYSLWNSSYLAVNSQHLILNSISLLIILCHFNYLTNQKNQDWKPRYSHPHRPDIMAHRYQ